MESKRHLIFHFYLPDNWRDSSVLKLHLRCLKHFSYVFTDALFVISTNDINDNNAIMEIEHKLIDCEFSNISFKVVPNNWRLCESETLYEEVVAKLEKLDGLTFFAHTKGIRNEMTSKNVENFYEWICGLYYLALNYNKEVESSLYTTPDKLSFGPYKTYSKSISNTHNWMYAGTFFWLNTQKLYDEIKKDNIEIGYITNRYFSENFLGNMYGAGILKDTFEYNGADSHNGSYIMADDLMIFYEDAEYVTSLILCEEELNRFREFKKEMIKNL